MRLFDYVYYRIYEFYLGISESGPWAFGIPAISFCHYLNILTIDQLIFRSTGHGPLLQGTSEYFIIGLIIVYNFVRYKWIADYDKLQELWMNEAKPARNRNGIISGLYIICSFLMGLYFSDFFTI